MNTEGAKRLSDALNEDPCPCDGCHNRPLCSRNDMACIRYYEYVKGGYECVESPSLCLGERHKGATMEDWICPHREITDLIYRHISPPQGFKTLIREHGFRGLRLVAQE